MDDDNQLVCQKHQTMLVFDLRLRELVCYPCREATGSGLGRGTSKKDFMAIDPDKDKHIMFKYRVYDVRFPTDNDTRESLEEVLNRFGSEGNEVVAVVPGYSEHYTRYFVTVRIHHST